MTRKFLRFTSTVALLIAIAVGFRPSFAVEYHIGTGQQYASLEAFRLAMEAAGKHNANNAHLQDGDVLVLHEDDHSLTQMLYVGYNATVTVKSNDPAIQREISPETGAKTRLFYLDGTGGYSYGNYNPNRWSRINFDGISKISGGYGGYSSNNYYDYSAGGGGAIYAWWHNYINNLDVRGITFEDNFSRIDLGYGAGGGAIYYWDALDCDLTDTSFINNKSEGPGGALYINASVTLYMSDTTNITIGASEGRISTFRGNLDNVEVDNDGDYVMGTGTPNSIDFTGSSGNHVNLFIKTAKDGILDMQDPFRTNTPTSGYVDDYYTSYTVNVEKSGPGTWKLGGDSVIDGSSGTTISIKEGTLEFYQGASLNAIGYNDEFNVAKNARVLIHGDNEITGTRVLFTSGAFLTFDMSYYFPNDYPAPAQNTNIPMLKLSGETLQVSGTRIDVNELPNDSRRNGDYVLIQGTSTLEIGDFNLYISGSNIDISGRVSKRFGYSLGYGRINNTVNDRQLVLNISNTDNTVLQWNGGNGSGQWSVVGDNWLLIRDNSTDSFIPGDTVQFFDDNRGTHLITLTENVTIGPDNNHLYYTENSDNTGMHVSGNGNWTFSGGSILDNTITGPASLLFDGSGTLALANDKANTYSGGTRFAGTGTVNVSRGDQLGLGNVQFLNNSGSSDETSTLFFTGVGDTKAEQQFVAESGSNGLITLNTSKNLTFRHVAEVTETPGSAVHVKNGGKLTVQANPRGRYGNIYFEKNGTREDGSLVDKGSAVYVENGGEFNAIKTTFLNNQAQNGGIVYNEGTTTIFDSTFTGNIVEAGGVIHAQSSPGTSTLTIGATAGNTTLFSGNINHTTGSPANSVFIAGTSGTANVIIDTELNGLVEMRDTMAGGSGSYTANVTKKGDGIWKLAGTNKFQSTGTTTFEIESGRVELYKADIASEIETGEIVINNGTFKIDANAGLNSRRGNSVQASTIDFADNAILGFDLTESRDGDRTAILTLDAGTWNFNNGKQTIDVLALSKNSNYGLFDLVKTNTNLSSLNLNDMGLLYHGEDMRKLRQTIGNLKLDSTGETLQLQVSYSQQNGITRWTGATGNATWDATSFNWEGESTEIAGSAQFLHGDAVIFGNDNYYTVHDNDVNGEVDVFIGTINIIDGGITISRFDNSPGMVVNNDAQISLRQKVREDVVDPVPGGDLYTYHVENVLVDNDYVFTGGSIGGDGALLKQGTGKLVLTQQNTYSGGTVIEGGTVVAQHSASLGTGGVNLRNSSSTLQFDLKEIESVFDGKISGEGKLLLTGSGAIVLQNKPDETNSFSGGTTVLGGTLIARGANTINSGEIVTGIGSDYGTVVFDLIENGTVSKTISGTGIIKTTGDHRLTLSGENTYSGGTIIGAGSTLVAKNISATGTGNIDNQGKLIFDVAVGGTFNQLISGSGSLEKYGDGILELGQANTYYGQTRLFGGTLRLTNEFALQKSELDYQGGRLELGTLGRLQLGGLSGTQDLSLTNSDNKAIALTIGSNNENSAFSGGLLGTGSVTKNGTGTQIFAGRNTYSGGTLISGGRLVSVGALGFGLGSVQNDAEMELQILDGNEELYKGLIVGTGSLWKSGTGTLTLGSENGYTGGTFIKEGRIATSSVGSLGTGDIALESASSSLYLDIANEQTVTQDIDGVGSVYKAGLGTLTFNKNINTTGTFDILGGTAFINGNAQSETTVYNGATLGGRGFVDNKVTFLKNSSQIVGDNKNATLSRFTAKNIAYENGSTVYIKVGMNASDQIIGKEGLNFAQGGGVVNVRLINLGDDFDPEKTVSPKEYEIFVADNGRLLLDGTRIDNTESDSDKLTVEGVNGEVRFIAGPDEGLGVLGYSVKTNSNSGRSLSLNLSATGPGAIAYLNTNQRSVLRGLGDAEIFDGIYSCNREYRGAVIDQFLPLIQTAMPFVTERSISMFNIATFERLRFLREPLALTDKEVNAYRGSSHRLAHLHAKTNYLWFQNYGDFIRMDAHGGTPEFQVNSYGYTFGVDRGINYHSSVGVGMGGYTSDVRANSVYQQADVDSFQFALYGNWVNDDNWMVTGSGGFVFTQYDLKREIPFFASTLESRHSGVTSYFSLEGSKKLLFGKYEVSPYIGTDFIWIGENGYIERATTGLSNLALAVKDEDTFTILTTAGFRLGRSMRLLGGNIVNPSLYAAWVHDWTNSNISSTASFPGEPTFKIRGASMNRDRAQIGANVNMTLNKRTDMFTRWNAEVADHYSNLSFHLGFRLGY